MGGQWPHPVDNRFGFQHVVDQLYGQYKSTSLLTVHWLHRCPGNV